MAREFELPDLKLAFNKLYTAQNRGVVPAVILDGQTDKLLTVAFMDREALKKSRESRLATFWSRTRGGLWTKGETSGNKLAIQRWLPDCREDALAVWVKRDGPVCHTGTDTCFGDATNENNGLPDFNLNYSKLYYKGRGVVPAVILDSPAGHVLTVGLMNRELFEISREKRLTAFLTDETSTNNLLILGWSTDCDSDTIAAWVKRNGPVCHRGTDSCFDQI